MKRIDQRHEDFTDPAQKEVVNAIVGEACGSRTTGKKEMWLRDGTYRTQFPK